ncbi:hypothetical protein GOM49_03565 [Clostridium bovifaecis]|uniref:Uncharacterized protein n=1 Tax=Clostridium bovifaecis TaxID=2184719 RepID=A0A6I6EVX3_9CLOT|nr:hypothetical protein GOM49_03565 [Clostridium bovifaecis]
MSEKSHIDINKLNSVPSGHPFEYKDVVMENFPVEKRTVDGKKFKAEVENGEFEAVITEDDTDRVQYKKL